MGTRTQDAEKTKGTGPKQDTPGRAKPSSSRQQTQPDQVTQTGSPTIDSNSKETDTDTRKASKDNYRDRPTDDGKHGDGHQEPNAGFPSTNE